MAGLLDNNLLCSIIIALIATVWSLQPLILAPYGSEKTGSYIIVLKKGSSTSKLEEVITKIKTITNNEVQIQRYTEFIEKTVTVKIPRDVLNKVRDLPEVDHVEEEDMAYGSHEEIELTQYSSAKRGPFWFLDHLNLPTDENEQEVADVYVLDTGIDFEHSEFGNRAKYAGYDPIDQYNIGVADYKPQRGRDCNGHGTLVASLIGGKTYGVAKNVNLFSVRVLGCDRAAPFSVVLDGLNFIVNEVSGRKRPAIVSMALSGSHHASVNSAIRYLYDRNVLVVASAGNFGDNACSYSPSSNNQVLTVGAIGEDNIIYPKSNYGACVDIFAPGESITGAEHTCPTCTIDGASGTSLAAALVCGIAAVHLSRYPLINPATLKQTIIDISSKDLIYFTSDSQASPNRLASFDCGGTIKATTSSMSVIQSLNFPSNYPNSLHCTWNIVAEAGQYIELMFEFIKLEEDYDFLAITSGSSTTRLTGDYGEVACGYVSTSNSHVLKLDFYSDETIGSAGFKAAYRSVRETSASIDECVKPLVNDILQLDILSKGQNVGNRFSMSKDWQEFFGGRRQGINLAVLQEDSGKVVLQRNFDISKSHQASELAETIEKINPGSIVLVSTNGQLVAHSNLPTRTTRAISTLGSSQVQNLREVSSWALIGIKGLQPGRGIEKISNSMPVDLSTQVKLQPYRTIGLPIMVKSAGTVHGNYAIIIVDGVEMELKNERGRTTGLNALIIDEKSGETLESRLFSTHSEYVADSSPSNDFVDFISSLPKGRIIAIAIKGDAIAHLSEDAKRACESIGSRHIRQVEVGGSWAIVGRKGASMGTVPESASNCANAQALYYLPSTDDSCQISVTTSGFVNGGQCFFGGVSSYLSVNREVYPTTGSTGRGITVAIIQEEVCAISRVHTFDTYHSTSASQDLVTFLSALPEGQIVVATAFDEASQHLSENAKISLEGIGSAMIRNVGFRDAWAIIGRKGAAKGSVPETYDANTASIGYHVPLRFGIPIMVKSAGKTYGNYGMIFTHRKIANSGSTGLNVITVDEHSGQVLDSRNFRTHGIQGSSASKRFATFIASLSKNIVVAIAIKGDAIAHLSEDAKRACESIGSRHIRQVEVGGSWAIVGRKGASMGTVPESASNCANAQALYYLPSTDDSCQISVTTSGFVNGGQCFFGGVSSYLSVNREVYPTTGSTGRGITVAIIQEEVCAISRVHTFDTYHSTSASQDLVTFLSALPEGQIVVATAFDEASQHLSENAKISLEGIGSAMIRNVGFRDAWAIIGRKGAAKGSVPETYDANTASIGYSAPKRVLFPTVNISSCSGMPYPLNCRAGLNV